MIRTFLLLLAACGPAIPNTDSGGKPDPDRPDPDSGDTGDTGELPAECDALTPLPLDRPQTVGTFTNAEDFSFNADGQHVSIDAQGNLVGITMDGTRSVLYPGLGASAGVHHLADGSFVYADVNNNTVVNLDYRTGDFRVIASGLSYPNGLDVGRDGYVYLAETARGGVRRIDPVTGESTVIALGLHAPNGVSFGPSWDDLYVGSFGGGVVYHMRRQEDDSWSRPVPFALTPGAEPIDDPCATGEVGTTCATSYYGFAGQCVSSDLGYNICETAYDTSACVGLAPGDECTTEHVGAALSSVCVETAGVEGLFCASAPGTLLAACEGKAIGERCFDGEGGQGSCETSFEGQNICYAPAEGWESYTAPCEDQELGAECVIADWLYPMQGDCQDGSAYGIPENICLPDQGSGGEFGMLDGLNVDVCGNVYATAYVAGHVYRWTGLEAEPELVVDVRSQWIPNFHWGNGIGGWEKDVLYMADRERGNVFPLAIGVEGHGEAYEAAP